MILALVLNSALLWQSAADAISKNATTIAKVVFTSNTTDDYDKPADVRVDVWLLSDSGDLVLAQGSDENRAYQENSENSIDLAVRAPTPTKMQTLGFRLRVRVSFNGHEPWSFIPKLALSFSDGTIRMVQWDPTVVSYDVPTVLVQDQELPDLARRYAPQLMHPIDEPNLPANVKWFLPRTTLRFHNAGCPQDDRSFGVPTQELLNSASVTSACGGKIFKASGTRSAGKSKTFLLTDVSDVDKRGSMAPADWITYYHSYLNDVGGRTIQYWTFYAFNTGKIVHLGPLPPVEVGYHGGDWEMVAVVLNADGVPIRLTTTGHTQMEYTDWSAVSKSQSHPIVYTERGGHEAHATPQGSGPWIQHSTWPGSLVAGLPAAAQAPGPLVDLGTRLRPAVPFLSYSGLWGSLGVLGTSSGYWGPAFNETGMPANGFLAAWCDGIANPNESEGGRRECYADDNE